MKLKQMRFIARQAIFDLERRVQAYELLFRRSAENRYTGADPDLASQQTFDTAVLLGLDVLSDGYNIFLNCPHDFIVQGFPTLFPADFTVIEVLETVEPDESVMQALQQMKRAGYRIALDDFVEHPKVAPLVELADFIKLDFRTTPPALRRDLAQRYGSGSRQLLAEKVETEEEFSEAAQLGFSLFQGYLLGKPDMLSTPKVPVLVDTHRRIQRVLSSSTLDLIAIEQLIKSEPALCYRLLRYLKSPGFYLQTEVESILHVLALLGEDELRKWLMLMSAVVAAAGEPKPGLIAAALAHARFAELLAPYASAPGSSLFLTSLFSHMERLVQRPLPVILEEVVLPEQVHDALAGEVNPLEQCNELVMACERGDTIRCDALRKRFRIPASELRATYQEALLWAGRITNYDLAAEELAAKGWAMESWKAGIVTPGPGPERHPAPAPSRR